jgi:NADH/NAD ratio-sensing transcriptional regulator Rex
LVLATKKIIIFKNEYLSRTDRRRQEEIMEPVKTSERLRRRLPIYLEHLKSLPGEDSNISATSIAAALGLGHVLVRKDLAIVSCEGRCRTGRSRKQLIRDIEGFLESLETAQ